MTINSWGSDLPVSVSYGGTGVTTLPQDEILLGNGTSPITSIALDDGETLIGSTGVAPVAAQIGGTADEIDVTSGAGSVQVSLSDNPIWPGTGAITVPRGTTAERPVSPSEGMLRFNTTSDNFEGYQDSAWMPYGAGLMGAYDFITTLTNTSTTAFTITSGDLTGAYNSYLLAGRIINQNSSGNQTITISIGDSSTVYSDNYSSSRTRYDTSDGTFSGSTSTAALNISSRVTNFLVTPYLLTLNGFNSAGRASVFGYGSMASALGSQISLNWWFGARDSATGMNRLRFNYTGLTSINHTVSIYGLRLS